MIDSIGTPRYSELTEVFEYIDRSPNADFSYFYQQGIIEDDYNISLQTFDSLSNDSAPILDYRRIKSLTTIDESFEREKDNMSSTERLQRIERMSSMDKARYEMIFMDFADTKPIQMRVNNLELELLLRQEFLLEKSEFHLNFVFLKEIKRLLLDLETIYQRSMKDNLKPHYSFAMMNQIVMSLG